MDNTLTLLVRAMGLAPETEDLLFELIQKEQYNEFCRGRKSAFEPGQYTYTIAFTDLLDVDNLYTQRFDNPQEAKYLLEEKFSGEGEVVRASVGAFERFDQETI